MRRLVPVGLLVVFFVLAVGTCASQSGSCHCAGQTLTIVHCYGSGGCDEYVNIESPGDLVSCVGYAYVDVPCCGHNYLSYSGLPYVCVVTGPDDAASCRDSLMPPDRLDFGAAAGRSGGAVGKGQTAAVIARQ